MFGDKLKELRNRENITQYQFAGIFKISTGTIAMWETNKRQPDFDMLQKIADYFDVSVDYLLGRTDEPKGGLIVPPILQSPDVRVAFHGGIEGLTQRDIDELARMAELLKKKNTENK